jgi:hypothetical protein
MRGGQGARALARISSGRGGTAYQPGTWFAAGAGVVNRDPGGIRLTGTEHLTDVGEERLWRTFLFSRSGVISRVAHNLFCHRCFRTTTVCSRACKLGGLLKRARSCRSKFGLIDASHTSLAPKVLDALKILRPETGRCRATRFSGRDRRI